MAYMAYPAFVRQYRDETFQDFLIFNYLIQRYDYSVNYKI